jgi:uncharacterized protein YdeI (YjbR/CyaY-like superfamily)
MADYPTLRFESQATWQAWLEAEHAQSDGIWLKLAKKDSGIASVSYAEALDVALCFGWIDGQKKGLDESYWLQKFTPRRAKSVWSVVNREKVAQLIADGKMRAAGQREIDNAKADGRWEAAYAPQSRIEIPEDFQAALAAQPQAVAQWGTLKSAERYSMLYHIHNAKKAETRQKRIAQYVELLAAGKTP